MAVKKERRTGAHPLVYIITTVLLMILCTAVSAAALIKPYEKVQTYLHIAFMDDMKIKPASGLDGLVIKENEISTQKPAEQEQQFSDTGEIQRPSFGEQYAVLEFYTGAARTRRMSGICLQGTRRSGQCGH